MGVAGSVIRIEGGLPENSDSIPGRPADDNASVAAHSSGSAAEASDHIADSSKPCSGAFDRTGGQFWDNFSLEEGLCQYLARPNVGMSNAVSECMFYRYSRTLQDAHQIA